MTAGFGVLGQRKAWPDFVRGDQYPAPGQRDDAALMHRNLTVIRSCQCDLWSAGVVVTPKSIRRLSRATSAARIAARQPSGSGLVLRGGFRLGRIN